MKIVTKARLDRANVHVMGELMDLGLFDEKMEHIEVYLVPAGWAYGWQNYGGDGHINIPRISVSGLASWFGYEKASLRSILRHEWGHAFADTHQGVMRSRRFREAFGDHHESSSTQVFDPEVHVSSYAAKSPSEDFAEVLGLWVKNRGRLPSRFEAPAIVRKWGFVDGAAAGG